MSFGDGQAQSIGSVGYSKYISISDGNATVYSNIDTNILQFVSPISDRRPEFERSVLSNNIIVNNVALNSANVYVNSYMKVSKPYFSWNNELHNVVSVPITQYYPSAVIMSKTAQVIDKNDTNKYIIQGLWMDDTRINSKQCPVMSCETKMPLHKFKFVLSRNIPKQLSEKKLSFVGIGAKTKVSDMNDYRTNYNVGYVFVDNKVPNTRGSGTIIQPVTANVEDYKPPSTTKAFSGGGLKNFRLVVQKYAYFEQYLSFSTGTVTDITGLPQGVIFENGYLKGSPVLAGEFIISIVMDDKSVLSGLMIVPQTPRKL